MKRRHIIFLIYLVLLLYTFAPVLCVLACASIASHYGCQVDEANVHPCIVHGRDIGGLLYDLGVSGWFMLVTIPTGALALLIFTLTLIASKLRQYI